MLKVTLYKSDLRHIGVNKYANNKELEKNLTLITTLENATFNALSYNTAEFLIEKSIVLDLTQVNYIKCEIDNKKFYYTVNTFNYMQNTYYIRYLCDLDYFHTFISDFYNQETIDRNILLEMQQATVRKDIVNKTTYIFDNPYLLHLPQAIDNLQTISKVNYEMEVVNKNVWFRDDKDEWKKLSVTPTDTSFTFGNIIVHYEPGNEDTNFYGNDYKFKIQTSGNIYLAVINTNNLTVNFPKERKIPSLIFIPLNAIWYSASGISYEFSTWEETIYIPKENLVNIIEIPFNMEWLMGNFTFVMKGKTLDDCEPYTFITKDGKFFYFIIASVNGGFSPEYVNGYNLVSSTLKYLNQDSWNNFYNDLIVINDYHSTLLLYYTIEHSIGNDTFIQKLNNIYSNDPTDKPYMNFVLSTNGHSLIYTLNYQNYFYKEEDFINNSYLSSMYVISSVIVLTDISVYADTQIINSSPYWLNYLNYEVWNKSIDTTCPSQTDSWTEYLANHSWSATTGVALQKKQNMMNAGFQAAGSIVGGGMFGGIAGALGGGLGIGSAFANAAINNQKIEGSLTDTKHTPASLNYGLLNNSLYNKGQYSKTRAMFLNESDIQKVNYYLTYYGNMVSQPMSLNEWIQDFNPDNVNYLKVANIEQAFNFVENVEIRNYFNDLFSNGVRLWTKKIQII